MKDKYFIIGYSIFVSLCFLYFNLNNIGSMLDYYMLSFGALFITVVPLVGYMFLKKYCEEEVLLDG